MERELHPGDAGSRELRYIFTQPYWDYSVLHAGTYELDDYSGEPASMPVKD